MVTKTGVATGTVGTAAGVTQTTILREMVDPERGTLVEALGNWGRPSVLGGIIGGIPTLGVGVYSVMTGKVTTSENIQMALMGYGASALFTGVLSGLFPVAAAPEAGARARLSVAGTRRLAVRAPAERVPEIVAPAYRRIE